MSALLSDLEFRKDWVGHSKMEKRKKSENKRGRGGWQKEQKKKEGGMGGDRILNLLTTTCLPWRVHK
jgi:hypothetical protein